MTPQRFSPGLAFLLFNTMLIPACLGPDEAPPWPQAQIGSSGVAPAYSYQEYRAKEVQYLPELDSYLVERDILVGDEAGVRELYQAAVNSPSALLVNRVSGKDDIWSRTDRWNISYCVSKTSFGSAYQRVVSFLDKAASAWENAANIRFVHDVSQDSNCTTSNNNVKYDVVRQDFVTDGNGAIVYDDAGVPVPFYAGMSLPSEVRSKRQLVVGNSAAWSDAFLLAVFLHEMGHGLGFRHEHIRAPGTNCTEGGTYRALTPYDSTSVMHYPFCPGWSQPGQNNNYITQWDIEGAQSVYEAPTNVLNGSDGVVYARQRSTGDLYKRSGASWTKIGNPGQAFITVGSTLYGQRPGRGAPVKYLGPNQGWVTIGAAAGQILNCGGALCATDPSNGNIARYDSASSTWTIIGGPGSRFQATQTQLFALTPWQDHVARWSGSGSGWTIVGNGACELFGGGTQMYRLTQDKNAIQRYASGSAWTHIGGGGRQFQPTAGSIYGLRPDGSGIFEYAVTQWNWVHGPAARMYGSYGSLYATSTVDESIEAFNQVSKTWISLGKP